MAHAIMLTLAQVIWGFVIASMITFVIYIVVDYRRSHHEAD